MSVELQWLKSSYRSQLLWLLMIDMTLVVKHQRVILCNHKLSVFISRRCREKNQSKHLSSIYEQTFNFRSILFNVCSSSLSNTFIHPYLRLYLPTYVSLWRLCPDGEWTKKRGEEEEEKWRERERICSLKIITTNISCKIDRSMPRLLFSSFL